MAASRADLPAARHRSRVAARRGDVDARPRRRCGAGTRGVTIAFEDVWFHYGEAGDGDAGVGAPRRELHGAAGRDARARRAHRRGQDDDRQSAAALLRAAARAHHGERRRHPRHSARRVAAADRLRAAGHLPLRRRRADEHPSRRAARRRGGDRGGGARRRGPRHRATAARLDQVLGERGASVSVGERQLLSFARAIAADPALLVLDEATSAVDSEIEAEIQRGARGR